MHLLKRYEVTRKDIAGIFFILVSFFAFAIFVVVRMKNKEQLLRNSFKYTIATTTGAVKNIRSSGPDVNYTFMFANKSYAGSRRFSYSDSINYNGGKYYVKFQLEDPNNNQILLDSPVIITHKIIPDRGWEKLPSIYDSEN